MLRNPCWLSVVATETPECQSAKDMLSNVKFGGGKGCDRKLGSSGWLTTAFKRKSVY